MHQLIGEVAGRDRRYVRRPVLRTIWGRALQTTSLSSGCP